jgi:hypothetical protein
VRVVRQHGVLPAFLCRHPQGAGLAKVVLVGDQVQFGVWALLEPFVVGVGIGAGVDEYDYVVAALDFVVDRGVTPNQVGSQMISENFGVLPVQVLGHRFFGALMRVNYQYLHQVG